MTPKELDVIKNNSNAWCLPDSGARQTFASGSVRDTQENKGRYDLLPFTALERIAIHTEHGAKKYGDRNWEKGQPVSRYINSAIRHITKFCMGRTDEDHLAAAIWNLMCIMHTMHEIENKNLPVELGEHYERRLHWGEQCREKESHECTQDSQKGEKTTGDRNAQKGDDIR